MTFMIIFQYLCIKDLNAIVMNLLNYTDEQLSQHFDFLEDFISANVKDWNVAPDTTTIERLFSNEIRRLSNEDFALLLMHTGYIPEIYLPDSSQETLYSKLIESITCEWARRIGFVDSYLQTQKSNKEDVTIKLNDNIIVCDAKSFRLGRSQAAPNVKDTIKKQAYTTWLEQYPINNRVGGLVSFPSLHDWQKGSEAYIYFTSDNPPVMFIFYEQMAFMLLNNIRADKVIDFLKSYNVIFPNPSKEKIVYWNGFNNFFFADKANEYDNFCKTFSVVISKKVKYSVMKLSNILNEAKASISNDVNQLSYDELKEMAIEARYNELYSDLERQRDNIIRFRQ